MSHSEPTDFTVTNRSRASTPRTKAGCSNCRQRRIKCDQSRPECHRCTRSGWICSGYTSNSQQLTSLSMQETGRPMAAAGEMRIRAPTPSLTLYSLPYKVPGSQEERKFLHYFSQFAAKNLDGNLGCEFWSRNILQRCQSEVAVRQAAVALGCLHLDFSTAPRGREFAASEESLYAYQKAMRSLRRYISSNNVPDRTVVLMCSAIFYCLELVQGERSSAVRHLRSAADIWNMRYSASSYDAIEQEQMLHVLMQMDLQATIFDDCRRPAIIVSDLGDSTISNLQKARTDGFNSISDVYKALVMLLHRTLAFLVPSAPYKYMRHSVPKEVIFHRQKMLEYHEMWERRLTKFEMRRDVDIDLNQHDQQTLAVVRLNFLSMNLLVLHCLQDTVMERAPSFDSVGQELLALARKGIGSSQRQQHSLDLESTGQNSFSINLGVVAPLILVALKTSHQDLQVSAVELLTSIHGRCEGFHNAGVMAKVIGSLAQKNQTAAPGTTAIFNNDNAQIEPLEWARENVTEPRHLDSESLEGLEKLFTI